jgi:hypothetical protein
MDRERKLLYTVAVLTPILEVLTFTAYRTTSDLPSRATLLEEVRSCEQRLVRAHAACTHRPRPHVGISNRLRSQSASIMLSAFTLIRVQWHTLIQFAHRKTATPAVLTLQRVSTFTCLRV